jgi:hypothetical protein
MLSSKSFLLRSIASSAIGAVVLLLFMAIPTALICNRTKHIEQIPDYQYDGYTEELKMTSQNT